MLHAVNVKLQDTISTSFQCVQDLPYEVGRRLTALQGDVSDVKEESKSLAVNPIDDLMEGVDARPLPVGLYILEDCSELPLVGVFHSVLSTRHVLLDHLAGREGCVFRSLKGMETHEAGPDVMGETHQSAVRCLESVLRRPTSKGFYPV